MNAPDKKPLTGRKVFLMFAAGFGLIIAVNVVMAVQAVRTFPGLEVRNSYVASQSFDADRAAQNGLGWELGIERTEDRLVLSVSDLAGAVVEVSSVTATLGRTTHTREDQPLEFLAVQDRWETPVALAPGRWLLRIEVTGTAGERFHQRRVIHVPERVSG